MAISRWHWVWGVEESASHTFYQVKVQKYSYQCDTRKDANVQAARSPTDSGRKIWGMNWAGWDTTELWFSNEQQRGLKIVFREKAKTPAVPLLPLRTHVCTYAGPPTCTQCGLALWKCKNIKKTKKNNSSIFTGSQHQQLYQEYFSLRVNTGAVRSRWRNAAIVCHDKISCRTNKTFLTCESSNGLSLLPKAH